MEYDITKTDLPAQPALVQRRKVAQGPEIAQAIGEALGSVFAFAQRKGVPLAGQPFARYLDVGPGSMTLEPGVRVADGASAPVDEGDDVQAITLPAGQAATTVHRGPYDELHQAYAALEQWITAEGLSARGAPWEVYVTDPAEVEDPSEWETEIFWPVA